MFKLQITEQQDSNYCTTSNSETVGVRHMQTLHTKNTLENTFQGYFLSEISMYFCKWSCGSEPCLWYL